MPVFSKTEVLAVILIVFILFILINTLRVTSTRWKQESRLGIQYIPDPELKRFNILYWHRMFNTRDFYMGLGSSMFENCSYKNCFTTDDKTYTEIDQFDAIIFHGPEYDQGTHGRPAKRSAQQVYIFYDLESPLKFPYIRLTDKYFYNWTMTYRSDSDIYHPYGAVVKEKTEYKPPDLGQIQSRSKKIAWFVSNCNSPSKRHILQEKIQKFMPVDVYGQCGNLECPRNNETACYDMLQKDYKFYFSFENSDCTEYVTEKLFTILQLDVIPIVYGGVDYKKRAPPHSVINVKDFTSVENLVNYLQFLDDNPREYLNYFKWKKDYVVRSNLEAGLCNLCAKLNQEHASKSYEDVSIWWLEKKSTYCSNSFIDHFN